MLVWRAKYGRVSNRFSFKRFSCIYLFSKFSYFRCAEQIRNDIDYHNLSVTVVSIGAGLGYGNLGYSRHAIQDYALMRSFPNTLIAHHQIMKK